MAKDPKGLTELDVSNYSAVAGFTDMPHLTSQQERFVMFYLKGMSPKAAGKAAGYADSTSSNLMSNPAVQKAIEVYREYTLTDIKVTRDTLTEVFMEAIHEAANAGEKVMAGRELGKLHGLYAEQKKTIHMDIDHKITNHKQIERLSDQELGKMIGEEILLDPEDYESHCE